MRVQQLVTCCARQNCSGMMSPAVQSTTSHTVAHCPARCRTMCRTNSSIPRAHIMPCTCSNNNKYVMHMLVPDQEVQPHHARTFKLSACHLLYPRAPRTNHQCRQLGCSYQTSDAVLHKTTSSPHTALLLLQRTAGCIRHSTTEKHTLPHSQLGQESQNRSHIPPGSCNSASTCKHLHSPKPY